MHPQTNPDPLKHAVLDLLLEEHPSLWSLAELDRRLTHSSHAEAETTAIEDAVEDLYGAGLVHRVGSFVFATRAAHEAQRLAC